LIQENSGEKDMNKYWIVTEEPLAGFSYTNIIRLLWQNSFEIHPQYWLRFLYAISLSTLCLPLRITEYIRFDKKIKKVTLKEDPIFIIGHYRTGSTYLITLLSLDKSKGYVSNTEGYCPHFFLAFPKFSDWLLSLSLPEQRPMDEVIMGSTEPTEEEYSIGAYEKFGFYNGFIFAKYFDRYSKYNSFDTCPKRDLEKWKNRYYYFVQKMTLKYQGRRMIFKNPANTYRIKHLLKMFPNAKFIHLYRNPYYLFLSTLKFYREVFAIYALQSWSDHKLQQCILNNYKEMYKKMDETRSMIPTGNIIDIAYEDFIKDPLKHVKRIYDELHIKGFETYKDNFIKYIETQKNYKPNQHILTNDVIEKVNTHWDFAFQRFGYSKIQPDKRSTINK
jgi:hypothetical protein